MILASVIGSIIAPFANVFAWVLAGCYSFTHSYGWSIVLLTLATMVIVFPLTRAGTRSMMRMQLLQPEMKKIQNKYKSPPGTPTEERQANRLKLNEEMMALYRENGVNPTGGCLPMFIQFPIFIVLYDVIRGMTRTVTRGTGKAAHTVIAPQYIPKRTQLYHAVISSHAQLNSFGVNLADSVRSPGSLVHKIPYIIIILIAIVLQYVSIWQITNRNPSAANANPQMQTIQKVMPLIFAFMYILFPAGVGVYFIFSSAFRVVQQEYMYKHDPKIVELAHSVRELQKKTPPPQPGQNGAPGGQRRGFMDRLREAAATSQGGAPPAGRPAPKMNGAAKQPVKSGGTRKAPPPRPQGAQNRSRSKRPRR